MVGRVWLCSYCTKRQSNILISSSLYKTISTLVISLVNKAELASVVLVDKH